ncbi:MAG: hypothetical protein JXA71_08695, partial [Chitinispirillaceae bacterium]|nr:hypothetical protein [Chitinispirillaceae bacterium]
WYRQNQFPTARNLADPNLIRFPLSRLIATGNDRYDSVVTVSRIGCFSYYFKGSVHWKNSSTGRDSIPLFGINATGDSVLMCDMTRIINPLRFAFSFSLPSDSTVVVTVSGLTVASRQFNLISSLVLRYALGNAVFTDSVISRTSLESVGDALVVTVKDPRFAGAETWSQWQLVFRGINNNPCDTVRDSCRVGTPLPDNTAQLFVDSVLVTRADLSWRFTGGPYDRIRVWHGKLPVPDSAIPAGLFAADTFSATASGGSIMGLEPKTSYHCGLQLERYGRWSLVTPAARCTLPTDSISDDIPVPNTLRIDTVFFDTATAALRFVWRSGTSGMLLNAGVAWRETPGAFSPPIASTTKFYTHPGATPDTFTLGVDGVTLEYGRGYHFGVWLQKDQGLWSAPTDSSTRFFVIPQPASIKTVIFSTTDIIAVFNGAVVLRKIDDMQQTVTLKKLDCSTEGSGLVRVSPIVFGLESSSASLIRFLLGLRYEVDSLPPGTSAGDIRMYRYDAARTLWLRDTATLVPDESGAPILNMVALLSQCTFPFFLAVDTVAPEIVVEGDTASIVTPQEPIPMTVRVQDNIANPSLVLLAGQGYDRFVQHDTVIAEDNSMAREWRVRSDAVQGESGIRVWFVADDGRFRVRADVSRDIGIDRSDAVKPYEEQWTPLGATAVLEKPGTQQALDEFKNADALWKYDRYAFRLFRYLKNGWREYSEAEQDSFSFEPGRLLWLKTRQADAFDFGSGRSVSLKTPWIVRLPPKSWTDFCLPYRFDIRTGDVLDSCNSADVQYLQFYLWKKDARKNMQYYADGFYLPLNALLNDRSKVMCHTDTNGNKEAFTVWNASDSAVELRIPGIPTALSAITSRKAAAAGSWSVAVRPRTTDGMPLSPLFIAGAPPGARQVMTSPLPPSWSAVSVALAERGRQERYGAMVVPAADGAGYAAELVFDNPLPSSTTFQFDIEQAAGNDIDITVVDPATGSVGGRTVTVAANSRAYRLLVIGKPGHGIAPGFGAFALSRISPNPCNGTLRIEYTLPWSGIERIRCDLIDQLGRVVWSADPGRNIHPGRNVMVWSEVNNRKRAAGAYIVRLTGFDGSGKQRGESVARILFVP